MAVVPAVAPVVPAVAPVGVDVWPGRARLTYKPMAATPATDATAMDLVMDLARPSASSRWRRACRIAAVDWSFQALEGLVVLTGTGYGPILTAT